MKSLNSFVEAVLTVNKDIDILDGFFCGFSIPQISKEFDLLKIYKKDYVVNIELEIVQKIMWSCDVMKR